MANTNVVIDFVTKESLRLAHEKATFLVSVDLSYDDQFKDNGKGKKGATIRVRDPEAYTRRKGSRIMDVQDTNSTAQNFTVATQDGVDLRFNSQEAAQDLDAFSKRHIEPAMAVLISGIEADMLTAVTKDIYNVVGTPGTVVGASNDITALGLGRARLNQMLAPQGMRNIQMDSVTMASIVNANKGVFSPTAAVEKAWKEGYYGQGMGAKWYENERTYVHTVGSDVTVSTSSSAAVTDGGTNITMNGSDGNINAGDVFTVAGVYACHPETKKTLGYLQPFVATAASTGAVTVSPATVLTGAKQNVCSAASTQLATTAFNSQVMTFFGSAGVSYRQNLIYHPEAFAFSTADLPLMDDAMKCQRQEMDGISLRVWQASDIRNDEMLMRIDILYGWKTLRPAWATRITN